MKSMSYLDILAGMDCSPCYTTLLPQIMHYKNLSTIKKEKKKTIFTIISITMVFTYCVYMYSK